MKIIILGSGGAMPTPRPFCQCNVCEKARKIGAPYKRNSSSLYLPEINTVIDCGEDIADSLNREKIKQVDHLFITHWHPDHTFGFRSIIEANYDFRKAQPKMIINVYIPKKVFEILKQKIPAIEYWLNVQKTGRLHLVEDGQKIEIGDQTVTVVGYQGKNSETYAYLIEQNQKKLLYAPCDTISFKNYRNFPKLNLLINECGLFSDIPTEISFTELVKRMREIQPNRIILTHLEEVELNIFGEEYLEKLKEKYSDLNFEFAFDGMQIEL